MDYVRYFVLFFVVNATVCVNLTTRYLGAHAPPDINTTEVGDIFLPIDVVEHIPARISWYGKGFHGKPTASGERFDMNSVSVAHVSLPFGTRVQLFNPTNNKWCDAVVNDSGPFDPDLLPNLEPHPRRQFDASRALAKCLGFTEEGVVNIYVAGTYNERPLTHEEVHSDRVTRSNERFANSAN